MRIVQINGGVVTTMPDSRAWHLSLPPTTGGYADAQIDDYGGLRRAHFPWHPGTTLRLRARFSHEGPALAGTAGFGLWNAPFGPGVGVVPALPQASWFFYGSPRNDLPFAPVGDAGNGWFAGTIDAGARSALAIAPMTLPVLLLNQFESSRRRLWPAVQQRLAISFRRLDITITHWHRYELAWRENGCFFRVDDMPVLQTPSSPRGPLGFVAWIDNQYLVATPTGRLRWGTEDTGETQSLAIRDLELRQD